MDPDTFEITIDEKNVHEVLEDHIIVEEEVIDKNVSIRLNSDQIQNELTQLLFDVHASGLSSRVASYLQMFKDAEDNTFHFSHPNKVIQFSKYEYYEVEKEIDEAYAEEQELKYVQLQTFLRQFYSLLKSPDASRLVKQRLDALFIPYVTKGKQTEPIASVEEAYRFWDDKVQHRAIRLLPNDSVSVKGYYVQNNASSTKYRIFDVDQYVQDLEEIKEGDDVTVVFKDFVWSINGRLVESIDGRVLDLLEDRWVVMDSKNERRVVMRDHSNAYIFPKGKPVYDLAMFITENVYYPSSKHFDKVVLPQSIVHVLYMYRNETQAAKNFQDIYDVINKSHNLPALIPHTLEPTLRKLVTKKQPALVKSKDPQYSSLYKPSAFLKMSSSLIEYPYMQKYFDSDLARYMFLHSNLAQENAYVCERMQSFVKKWETEAKQRYTDMELWHKRLQKELASIVVSKNTSCVENKPIYVSKIYTHPEDLAQDTGKKIFFDKELDPTEYGLKVKYSDADELQSHIRSKKPGITKDELDFEVKCILEGQRKIRIGDYAVLRAMGEDVLYVRRKVQGTSMWIKQQKLPFQWCADQLYTHADLGANPCISYQKTCKELDELKKRIQQEMLQEKYELVEQYLKYVDSIPAIYQRIEEDIKHFISLNKLKVSRKSEGPSMVQGQQEVTDDEEYDGDILVDPAKDLTNLAYQDMDHYAILPTGESAGASTSMQQAENNPAYEFIMTFTSFLGITLQNEDIQFIINWVDAKKSVDLKKQLAIMRLGLMKSVKQDQYKADPVYRSKVDEMIEKKLNEKEKEILSILFHDITLHSMSMLTLLIMSKYPDLLVHNIYPSCVRFLSYKGYPIYENNKQRSLLRYFACLIKHITSNDDPRYERLNKMTQEQIHDAMVKIVDQILEVNYQLKLKIETNKVVIDKPKTYGTTVHTQTWSGFKPDVKFEQASDPVVKLLSEMNRMIKDTNFLKKTIFSTPSVLNACCLEPLTPSLNYYGFFKTNSTIANLLQNVPKTTIHGNPWKFVLPLRNPSTTPTLQTNPVFFEKTSVVESIAKQGANYDAVSLIDTFMEKNPLYMNDKVLHSIRKHYDKDEFWNDDFFQQILQAFNVLRNVVSKFTTQFDEEVFTHLQNALVFMKDMNQLSEIRNALSEYVQCNIPKLLGKIINKKPLSEEQIKKADESPELQLLVSFLRNKDISHETLNVVFQAGWKNIGSLWFFKDQVRQINTITYVLVRFLYSMMYITAYPDVNVSSIKMEDEQSMLQMLLSSSKETKDKMQLVSNLAMFILKDLRNYLTRNDPNIQSVKKRIEELREKRKQDMISKYKMDDEERELQMALKKLGLSTWYDVGGDDDSGKDKYHTPASKEAGADIMKMVNQQEEDMNYSTKAYIGENADQDEVDEDFASHDVYDPKEV